MTYGVPYKCYSPCKEMQSYSIVFLELSLLEWDQTYARSTWPALDCNIRRSFLVYSLQQQDNSKNCCF